MKVMPAAVVGAFLWWAAPARGETADGGGAVTPTAHCERRPDDGMLFQAEKPGVVRSFDGAAMAEHPALFARLSAEEQMAVAVYSGYVMWSHVTARNASRRHIAAAVQLLRDVESKAAQVQVLWWISEVANRRAELVAPFRADILRERPRVIECAPPKRLVQLEEYFEFLARLPPAPTAPR